LLHGCALQPGTCDLKPDACKKSGRRASNPRPPAWEAGALPTELRPREEAFYHAGLGSFSTMNPPEYKFCPRCGGRLKGRVIKEGEPERLVCGECGFVFYLGPKLVAGAIIEFGGGMVLIQRAIEPGYGKWTFPGGFVERGEVAEAAAEREALEEAGLEIEVTGIVGLYSYEDQIPTIAVFAARATGGEPAPLDETLAVRSFPRDGLPWSALAFPSTEQALKDYLRKF
jgi:8-oxo-dGTP diphosphatase